MKTTPDHIDHQIEVSDERRREWLAIYATWYGIKNEPGAIDKTACMHLCSRNKVINAISYGMKFNNTK